MNLSTFRPLNDRILVKRCNPVQRFGTLIAPDVAQRPAQEGTVIAVGRGERDKKGRIHPIDLKPGEKVLFGVHDGEPIVLDEEEYLILRAENVRCARGNG
jgi:chaperonin GroES